MVQIYIIVNYTSIVFFSSLYVHMLHFVAKGKIFAHRRALTEQEIFVTWIFIQG